MQTPDNASDASQAEQGAQSREDAPRGGPSSKAASLLDVQFVHHAVGWGKQKYAGSSAEQLRNRLTSVDIINQALLFAATLLLCFFPFLIIADALAGRSTSTTLAKHAGLNKEAATDVGHLFASAATTSSAVTGTGSVVFFVLGGIAAATALQQLYERIFDLRSRGMKDVWRRIIWLAVLAGGTLLGGWAGPPIRHAVGPVLLAIVAIVAATAFWWLTLWILLGGRISWRTLFPCACATGVFYVGMVAVFSVFYSNMVISQYNEYGPIGTIFAIMTYLIALSVVIILGAVTGLVWDERGLSFASAFRKLKRSS